MAESAIACPDCRQVDSVQRVRSVVSGGTSSGSYSGPTHGAAYTPGSGWGGTVGHATLSGSSSTVLEQRLAPPTEPTDPRSYNRSLIGPAMLLLAVGGVISLVLIAVSDAAAYIGLAVTFGGLFVWEMRKRSSYKKHYESDHPRWQRMMQRWNDLFYCHRCDPVFDPRGHEKAQVEGMYALLARPYLSLRAKVARRTFQSPGRHTHASPSHVRAEALQHLDIAIAELCEMKMQPALAGTGAAA